MANGLFGTNDRGVVSTFIVRSLPNVKGRTVGVVVGACFSAFCASVDASISFSERKLPQKRELA